MSEPFETTMARLRDLPAALAVGAARDDQDRRAAAGDYVPAERYLTALPRVAASPDDALVLVYGEVLTRLAAGGTADVGEYHRRFPQYADRLAPLFDVHAAVADRTTTAPPPPPDLPGYHGLRFVARGGMGDVYRGRVAATGEEVAVKVVAAHRADASGALVRFVQEGEILARLDHPGIVRFVAAGPHRGRLYLATEWVAGGTLADAIGGKPWPVDRAVRLVVALADAVQYAHDRGVLHRDLKPSNVLLTEAGDPILTDFGVARLAACGGTLTATGDVLGTANYMAPEQVSGSPTGIGPATDVYGLAAVLYEVLTGRPPFPGRRPMEVIARVQGEAPVPPRALNPAVPVAVSRACLAGLSKAQADRYPTPSALARALIRASSPAG